jgi:hypothetical protein
VGICSSLVAFLAKAFLVTTSQQMGQENESFFAFEVKS